MTHTLPAQWLALLNADARTHLARATAAAEREAAAGKQVFPPRADWFAAFHHVAPHDVRVVILGQDPYPTRGNAMGLAFSVPRGVRPPASLKNIYKGLYNDLAIPAASHGDLGSWAAQGVLLLNSVLTVEQGLPNSHAEFGWRQVTDAVIAAMGSAHQTPNVFLLWGAHAQKKAPMIAAQHHLVLTAPHPSPLSARRGFFDCKHFSQANAFLIAQGAAAINWALPPATDTKI
ncbi:MAG: uracil-DNA glycosylase [Burkholderiales bacterium]|nr:uracil-DNA glycosylase [Burkholderiales bacterium]